MLVSLPTNSLKNPCSSACQNNVRVYLVCIVWIELNRRKKHTIWSVKEYYLWIVSVLMCQQQKETLFMSTVNTQQQTDIDCLFSFLSLLLLLFNLNGTHVAFTRVGGWVVVQVSCILCRLYLDLWYGLWLRQGVWPMRLHPCSHRPVCTDWCIWVWRRSPPSQHRETLRRRSRSSSWRQDYVSKAWGLCTQKLPEQKLCLLWLVCIVCWCIR